MTDKPTFSDFLEDDRVHIFDGAIGTLIYGRGVFVNVCYDALVLEQPELIRQIHADYAAAGAELIETNTFGANPMKLSGYGLEEKTREINREAAILETFSDFNEIEAAYRAVRALTELPGPGGVGW